MTHVEDLEKRLGFVLPDDYRSFLACHSNPNLDECLVFKAPKSGVIDHILTAEQILQNDAKNRIGIQDARLLYIGGNVLGGYLYLSVAPNTFGQIFYAEAYTTKETFQTFTAFLNETDKEF